jgi:hypothetical protein
MRVCKRATSSEWAKRHNFGRGSRRVFQTLSRCGTWWRFAISWDRQPGYADVSTLELEEKSDLLVLTSGTNLIELEPKVLMTRERMAGGVGRTSSLSRS